MTYKEKTRIYINNNEYFTKLEKYVKMIEEKNKVINLTSFKDDTLWREGIYESIICLEKSFKNITNKKMLDIGAGAGFPSIPFKIVNPKVKLFIYEPINKKIQFLEEVSQELNLNLNIQKIRAEQSKEKNIFSLITARAVTSLQALIEISFHLGKKECQFAFIKGPSVWKEIQSSNKIINELKLSIDIEKIIIENKKINIVKYKKEKINIGYKYPRAWSQIIKEIKK